MPERRNPVVRTGAILRKGGAHTKSVSGQRHQNRLRVDDAIDEWYELINEPPELEAGAAVEHADAHNTNRKTSGKSKAAKQKGEKGQSKTTPFSFALPCHIQSGSVFRSFAFLPQSSA